MIVWKKNNQKLFSVDFLMILMGLTLSTLLVSFALSSILLSVFVFFSTASFFIKKYKLTFSWALILPVSLYILFLVSYVWTINEARTLKGFGRMLPLICIPLSTALIPKLTIKNIHKMLGIFTASNVVLGIFFLLSTIFRYFKTNKITEFSYHNLVSSLDLNAIYVSSFFIISFFYLLEKEPKTKIDKLGVFFFLVLIILLSSKMAFIILCVGLCIFIFHKKHLSSSNKKGIFVFIFMAIITPSLISFSLYDRVVAERKSNLTEIFQKKEFGKVYPWTGTTFRLFQLRILREQFLEDSFFIKGYGLFASKQKLIEKHKQYNTYPGFHNYNYHNQYAQIFSELGILGLLLLLLLLTTSFVKAVKTKNIQFLIFTLCISLFFLTESMLWRQRGLFLFIILYSLWHRLDDISYKAIVHS